MDALAAEIGLFIHTDIYQPLINNITNAKKHSLIRFHTLNQLGNGSTGVKRNHY